MRYARTVIVSVALVQLLLMSNDARAARDAVPESREEQEARLVAELRKASDDSDKNLHRMVLRALDHPSVAVRGEAVDILRRRINHDEETIGLLIWHLENDPSAGIRHTMLGIICGQRVLTPAHRTDVATVARNDPSIKVRAAASITLLKHDGENEADHWDTFVALYKGAADGRTKYSVLTAISWLAWKNLSVGPKVITFVANALSEEDVDSKLGAMRALDYGSISDRLLIERLCLELHNPDGVVREMAAHTLLRAEGQRELIRKHAQQALEAEADAMTKMLLQQLDKDRTATEG